MRRECTCDYDPDYHRGFNQSRRGDATDERCHNEAEDHGLCTPCLFGCAP